MTDETPPTLEKAVEKLADMMAIQVELLMSATALLLEIQIKVEGLETRIDAIDEKLEQ